LIEHFARIAGTPAFEGVKSALAAVNSYLVRFKENIARVMDAIGVSLSVYLDGLIQRAYGMQQYLVANLDDVVARIDIVANRFARIVPMLGRMAKLFLQISAARLVAGTAISGVGAAGAAVSAGATMAPMLAGAVSSFTAATASAGGVMAFLSASIAPLLVPLGILVAVVAAVVAGVQMFGDRLRQMALPLFDSLGGILTDVVDIFVQLWAFVQPIFGFLGAVFIGFQIMILRLMSGPFRLFTMGLRVVARLLGWFGENVLSPVAELMGLVFLEFFDVLGRLGDAFNEFAEWIGEKVGLDFGAPDGEENGRLAALLASLRTAWSGEDEQQDGEGAGSGGAPGSRASTNIDMRGSRITVRQDFREADPDRVWIQMRDALEREAVSRTQSGFASALGR
jgi:hypothetical protein